MLREDSSTPIKLKNGAKGLKNSPFLQSSPLVVFNGDLYRFSDSKRHRTVPCIAVLIFIFFALVYFRA